MKKLLLTLTLGIVLSASAAEKDGWISLFDGKSLAGWKANESPDTFKVENGELIVKGPRAHLFYVGEVNGGKFKNFELSLDIKTFPKANSGVYIHTEYQETGWPRYGLECQVNVTQSDPKKSGSLYGVVDIPNPGLQDNQWYKTSIRVEGRHIVIKINDKITVDYTEPEGKPAFSPEFERRLGDGTFALQAHDPDSKVYFRNLKVRRLK